MGTAAGVASATRLPVLFSSGDTFASRRPDPVLQQVEHFGHPSTTVNDAFRPVVRYWDRIMHPAQVITSLPQAVGVLLDPAAVSYTHLDVYKRQVLAEHRDAAIAGNLEVFTDPGNIRAIKRYVEEGLFPWEQLSLIHI